MSCSEPANLLTKEMFINEQDHDEQLKLALSKFSSMGCGHLELTDMEQLLVNELLYISQYYPKFKKIGINPFE
jgi:hypothetical protein